MKILHLHPGPDTGGTSVGAARHLRAAGDEVRVFARALHAFEYPPADPWDDEAVDESIDWADVVILHNDPLLWHKVGRGRSKPLVIHHHGSKFRRRAHDLWHQGTDIGAVQIVSTVDLLTSVPHQDVAYWMPQAIDVPRMAAVRAACFVPSDTVRVAHAPTNRHIKGTNLLRRAGRQVGVEIDVIERKTWQRCLERKAMADIYWDQPYLGYGNNALEAWAMGLPVIAGASDAILARMRQEYGSLPFYPTTLPTMADDLRAMVESADLRAEWAARGMAHVERFHSPAAIVARAHALYGRAIRPIAQPEAVA